MTDLPDEIWEQVISFLPSTGPSLAHFSRVNYRFEQITRTYLRRKNRRFEKKLVSCEALKETRIDYLRGNLLPSNGPRARYQSSVAVCNNVLYIFGGYVDSFTAMNDSWYFSPKRDTWDRVVCSKTPQAKGGAVMVADEKRERLILFGGKVSQLPQSALAAFRTDVGLYPNELSVLNLREKKKDWHNIRLPNTSEGRTQAAGCILPKLDIFIIDGGSFDERNPIDPDQTLVLDIKNASPTSWRWAKVILEGDIPPFPRSIHAIVPVGDDSLIFTSNVVRDFKHCKITPIIDNQSSRRSFKFTFTNIITDHLTHMPAYMRGTSYVYSMSTELLVWLSPVKLSEEQPQKSGLAIHRLKFTETENLRFENLPRGEILKLNNSPLPCILGSTLHQLNSGFLVFGGAQVNPTSTNVWADLSGITGVEPTNHLMFLQI